MKLFILFVFSILSLSTLSITEEEKKELEEQLDNLIDNSPEGVSKDYWEGALTTYLNSCKGDNCACVLGVTEFVSGNSSTTGRFFFGGFAKHTFREMYASYGGVQKNKYSGPFAKKLTKCHAARTNISTQGSGANQKCRANNTEGVWRSCNVYRNHAKRLGIPEQYAIAHIQYASTLSGQYYLHDNSLCRGIPCSERASAGCPTIEARAMKDLCYRYIGSYAFSTSPGTRTLDPNAPSQPSEKGGVFYFFNGNVKSSREGAIRGIQKLNEQCGNNKYKTLGTGGRGGSGKYRNYIPSSGGNTATDRDFAKESSEKADENAQEATEKRGFFCRLFGYCKNQGDQSPESTSSNSGSTGEDQVSNAVAPLDEKSSLSDQSCSLLNGNKVCDGDQDVQLPTPPASPSSQFASALSSLEGAVKQVEGQKQESQVPTQNTKNVCVPVNGRLVCNGDTQTQ